MKASGPTPSSFETDFLLAPPAPKEATSAKNRQSQRKSGGFRDRIPALGGRLPFLTAVAPHNHEVEVEVSRCDAKGLARWKWRVTEDGYVYRNTSIRLPERDLPMCIRVYLHRQLLGIERGDERQVNHINRNSLDNRRENLEVVTRLENMHHWMVMDGVMEAAPA